MVSFDIQPPRRRQSTPSSRLPLGNRSEKKAGQTRQQASLGYKVIIKIIIAALITVGIGVIVIRLMLGKTTTFSNQGDNLSISSQTIEDDIFDYNKWQTDFDTWQKDLQQNNILISTMVEFDNERQKLDSIFNSINNNGQIDKQ